MDRRGEVRGGGELNYYYLPLGTASGMGAASELTDFGEPFSPKMYEQTHKLKNQFVSLYFLELQVNYFIKSRSILITNLNFECNMKRILKI